MPFCACLRDHRCLHSFPTRRSSDLANLPDAEAHLPDACDGLFEFAGGRCVSVGHRRARVERTGGGRGRGCRRARRCTCVVTRGGNQDRKSTRLNSSHVEISYAVLCLPTRPPMSPLFPYTTLFRSCQSARCRGASARCVRWPLRVRWRAVRKRWPPPGAGGAHWRRARPWLPPRAPVHLRCHARRQPRSEEHTSELQSRRDLVCRFVLAYATTDVSTLSLHDALPILPICPMPRRICQMRAMASSSSLAGGA